MSEDMTHQPVVALAQAQARIRELERENAELRDKLDAVPWIALDAVINGVDDISDYNQMYEWVINNRPQEVQS